METTDDFFDLPPTPSVAAGPVVHGAVHDKVDATCCRIAPFHPQIVFCGFCTTLLVGVRCIKMLVVIRGLTACPTVITGVVGEVASAQITPKSPLAPYRKMLRGAF